MLLGSLATNGSDRRKFLREPGSRVQSRCAVWGYPHENPGRRPDDRASGLGWWDPQENPGHRPKNRPIAFACDYNCFQILRSTMSFSHEKKPVERGAIEWRLQKLIADLPEHDRLSQCILSSALCVTFDVHVNCLFLYAAVREV